MRGTVRFHCFCTVSFHKSDDKIITKFLPFVKSYGKELQTVAKAFGSNRAFILVKSFIFS